MKARLEASAPPQFVGAASDDKKLWDQTRRFYALRKNDPAWIVAGKPQRNVEKLLAVFSAAADEGLDPQEYDAAALSAKVQALRTRPAADAGLELDLYLSYQLQRYARNVALGHPIARQIDSEWNLKPRSIDLPAMLAKAVEDRQIDLLAKTLAPPHAEYARLREMLQRYRQLAAGKPLQPIPERLSLEGAQGEAPLAALRSNLLMLGDLQEKPRGDDNVFDEDLSKARAEFLQRNALQPEVQPDPRSLASIQAFDRNLPAAIRRFESRHGLNPDGIPDAAMIAAMNVPLSERVQQIELNLERWRWMPADLGAQHLLVNIPGYSLQLRDKDAVALKMRVIVGQDSHRTPIFSDTMTEIVFSPYWNIPQSIQVKEMLPALAKDSGYLQKHDIEVVRVVDGQTQVVDARRIDWSKNADHYQLRQKPGDENSLGFVKFLFPNHYNVYLHDTPSDNLFDKLTRDLSHGCVRLEHPAELASYLLRPQSEWTPERIETAMHAGKEEHVDLKNPIPIHLVYLTARVDEDGVPQFFNDVYGYDARQKALLQAAAQ